MIRDLWPAAAGAAVLLAALISEAVHAQSGELEGRRFVAAPMLVSNPTLGTGGGVSSSYLYKARPSDPVSQVLGAAVYTDSDSYVLGLMNNGRYRADRQRVSFGVGYGSVNKDFSGAAVNVETIGGFYHHLFQLGDHHYAGFLAGYLGSNYSADNQAGEQFIRLVGIEDTVSVPVGLVYNFDTRDNQFFPTSGVLFELETQSAFEGFGSDESFNAVELNTHYYAPVAGRHVIAGQIYGRYTEDGAPYASQSYLGRRNVLRGFTAGEIAGERLTALQAEYRHVFNRRWKGVVFAGLAWIGGPTAEATFVDGAYTSAGLGVRYAIQPEQGVHLRVDIAFGNDENRGFYFGIREAF